MTTHERWMEFALKEARIASSKNEVPVGAVVVHKGVVIAKGFGIKSNS